MALSVLIFFASNDELHLRRRWRFQLPLSSLSLAPLIGVRTRIEFHSANRHTHLLSQHIHSAGQADARLLRHSEALRRNGFLHRLRRPLYQNQPHLSHLWLRKNNLFWKYIWKLFIFLYWRQASRSAKRPSFISPKSQMVITTCIISFQVFLK